MPREGHNDAKTMGQAETCKFRMQKEIEKFFTGFQFKASSSRDLAAKFRGPTPEARYLNSRQLISRPRMRGLNREKHASRWCKFAWVFCWRYSSKCTSGDFNIFLNWFNQFCTLQNHTGYLRMSDPWELRKSVVNR